ncbi:hypothetical protein [Phormidium sp. FACHB-592]|uniref:hypothetical protein n=1 Tax=Phormidium sp. FACHB-592 TaxID=2692850 RepID=UPI0016874B33|nr:hypothetical protein [Phormidium sp. FACHB-592]
MPRWTPEARQRQRELIQTWQPWQSSTGPISADGKATSAQNALKTGWYSAELRRAKAFLTRLDRQRRELGDRFFENF